LIKSFQAPAILPLLNDDNAGKILLGLKLGAVGA